MSGGKGRLAALTGRTASIGSRVGTSIKQGSWRNSALTTAERGYGYRWQKERAAFLEAHPWCEACLAERVILARGVAEVIVECAERGIALPYGNVVDHVIPHRGDQALFWDQGNWQTLCATHHSGWKQRMEHER